MSAPQRAAGYAERVRSVSLNSAMGAGYVGSAIKALNHPDRKWFFVLADIGHPSEIWGFVDEHPDSIHFGQFTVDASGSPPTLGYWTDHLPASYHNRRCALSFADGHAEIKPWISAMTKRPVKYSNIWNGSTIAIDPDFRDYFWMYEHATEPLPQ